MAGVAAEAMSRRTRFIAGLITLVGLVLSLAEGVLAGSCIPAMNMSEVSAASSQEMPHDRNCMPGHHDEQDRRDLPDCPFGPPGSQGCVLSASLPATSAVEIASSPEGVELGIASDTEPDLLLGSALFHPPKS
jgi:hypothetical protein